MDLETPPAPPAVNHFDPNQYYGGIEDGIEENGDTRTSGNGMVGSNDCYWTGSIDYPTDDLTLFEDLNPTTRAPSPPPLHVDEQNVKKQKTFEYDNFQFEEKELDGWLVGSLEPEMTAAERESDFQFSSPYDSIAVDATPTPDIQLPAVMSESHPKKETNKKKRKRTKRKRLTPPPPSPPSSPLSTASSSSERSESKTIGQDVCLSLQPTHESCRTINKETHFAHFALPLCYILLAIDLFGNICDHLDSTLESVEQDIPEYCCRAYNVTRDILFKVTLFDEANPKSPDKLMGSWFPRNNGNIVFKKARALPFVFNLYKAGAGLRFARDIQRVWSIAGKLFLIDYANFLSTCLPVNNGFFSKDVLDLLPRLPGTPVDLDTDAEMWYEALCNENHSQEEIDYATNFVEYVATEAFRVELSAESSFNSADRETLKATGIDLLRELADGRFPEEDRIDEHVLTNALDAFKQYCAYQLDIRMADISNLVDLATEMNMNQVNISKVLGYFLSGKGLKVEGINHNADLITAVSLVGGVTKPYRSPADAPITRRFTGSVLHQNFVRLTHAGIASLSTPRRKKLLIIASLFCSVAPHRKMDALSALNA